MPLKELTQEFFPSPTRCGRYCGLWKIIQIHSTFSTSHIMEPSLPVELFRTVKREILSTEKPNQVYTNNNNFKKTLISTFFLPSFIYLRRVSIYMHRFWFHFLIQLICILFMSQTIVRWGKLSMPLLLYKMKVDPADSFSPPRGSRKTKQYLQKGPLAVHLKTQNITCLRGIAHDPCPSCPLLLKL